MKIHRSKFSFSVDYFSIDLISPGGGKGLSNTPALFIHMAITPRNITTMIIFKIVILLITEVFILNLLGCSQSMHSREHKQLNKNKYHKEPVLFNNSTEWLKSQVHRQGDCSNYKFLCSAGSLPAGRQGFASPFGRNAPFL